MQEDRVSTYIDYAYTFRAAVFATPSVEKALCNLSPANFLTCVANRAERLQFKGGRDFRLEFIDALEFQEVKISDVEKQIMDHLGMMPCRIEPPSLAEGVEKYLNSQDFSWFDWAAKIILDMSLRTRRNFMVQPVAFFYLVGARDSKD
jgi:hypothetical protein